MWSGGSHDPDQRPVVVAGDRVVVERDGGDDAVRQPVRLGEGSPDAAVVDPQDLHSQPSLEATGFIVNHPSPRPFSHATTCRPPRCFHANHFRSHRKCAKARGLCLYLGVTAPRVSDLRFSR